MALANNIWLVIPCAGVGSRMKSEQPKQYLPLLDKTVLEHTLLAFAARSSIKGIMLATSETDRLVYDLPVVKRLRAKEGIQGTFLHTCIGGQERQYSVFNALNAIRQLDPSLDDTWVYIHDAARPCVLESDLDKLELELERQSLQSSDNEQAKEQVGALLATPSFNTLKSAQVDGGMMRSIQTLDRSQIWQAHTPQAFTFESIYRYSEQALLDGLAVTDDASIMEAYGIRPVLVEGAPSNIKITVASDLALAEFYLSS